MNSRCLGHLKYSMCNSTCNAVLVWVLLTRIRLQIGFICFVFFVVVSSEEILEGMAEGWESETAKERKSIKGTLSRKILLWQSELCPNEENWDILQSTSQSYSKR